MYRLHIDTFILIGSVRPHMEVITKGVNVVTSRRFMDKVAVLSIAALAWILGAQVLAVSILGLLGLYYLAIMMDPHND